MRRLAFSILLVAPVLMASPCFGGDTMDDFWGMMRLDFHRNNKWPDTFTPADREAVNAPFAVMVYNGWRAQNTIGPYHFEEGSANLTEAGRLKVQWILTQAPEQYRTIFVEKADGRQAASARVHSVRAIAARMALPGETPHVVETAIPARGWSAQSIDSQYRKFYDSQPAPVLPERQGGGSSDGGK
jgi:hypothetical protein